MRSPSSRRGRTGLLAAAVCALAALPAGSAEAVVPAGNLLQNPGAEGGSPDEPPGWATTDEFRVERYGSEFFPPASVGAAFGGGTSFFAGGGAEDGKVSTGVQTVDVSAAAPEIDAGNVSAGLSAYLGGIDDEGDQAAVSAEFRSGTATLGTALAVGPVTHTDRGDRTAFLLRSTSGAVPAGTRQIRVTITVTRAYGSYSDGYADNLSLTLGGGGGPAPTPGTTPTPAPSGTPTPGTSATPGTTSTPPGSGAPPSTTPAPGASSTTSGTTSRPGTVSTVTQMKRLGETVSGAITASAACKPGRSVVVKKGSKILASAKSRATGRFTLSSKKIKKAKGKVTVTIKRRTLSTGKRCAAITKQV